MDINPIRTEADYEAAVRAIDQLWSAAPGSPDADRLDVLATLVKVYQDKHHPIGSPDPVSAILFRIDQMNLTRKHLEKFIGSRSRVTEILNGTRSLSLSMIRKLHQGLGIPLDILIQEQERPVSRQAKKKKLKRTVSRSTAKRSTKVVTESVSGSSSKTISEAASKAA